MKTFEEFNIPSEEIEKTSVKEEIVEVLNIRFNMGMRLEDIKNITNKLINRNVTFTTLIDRNCREEKEIKMRIQNISIIFDPYIPGISIYVGRENQNEIMSQTGINYFKEIKIWGERKYTRKYTKDDPYGEEEWPE